MKLLNMVETKSLNHMIRLQRNAPADFKPQEIVYARFTMNPNRPRLGFQAEECGVVQNETLGTLLAKRCGAVVQPVTVVPKIPDPLGPGTITDRDVPVDKPCTVVLELSADWEWQFRTQDVGVTSKDDYSDDNCDLWHVNSDGSLARGTPANDANPDTGATRVQNKCRIVMFSVVRRGDHEPQKFNLHIEVLQSATDSVEIIIDPDVPNNGGTFQP
ncbi:nucleotide synthetase [Phenylobacterium sp.]|uniref:nucleotide synthetase n=1 Tax=Phenylobacterium sp. TaxID=1871053 RepID=UPI003BAB1E2D